MRKCLYTATLSALLFAPIHPISHAQTTPSRQILSTTGVAAEQKPLNAVNDGGTPYPGFTGDPYTHDPTQLITQKYFGNAWVNTIPEVTSVPSPYAHHGYIAGSPAQLTPYSGPKGTYDYFAALAKHSPRVKMWNIGKSHGGLDMYIVAISSAETIQRLDQYQHNLQQLADPRKLGFPATAKAADDAAEKLIASPARLKPAFWIFAKIHSNETSGSEMTMELAYRLAVDNRQMFDEIRNNLIVFITDPNPDGTDMVAEWVNRYKDDPIWKTSPGTEGLEDSVPLYNWYTQHADNRETFINSQPEWKNIVKANNNWPVQVQLWPHELAFLFYTASGQASPPETDSINQTESQWLAASELTQLEAFGMPGGTADPATQCMAYPFSGDMLALLKNAVGKHYETWRGHVGMPYYSYELPDPGLIPSGGKGAVWGTESPMPYPYPKLAWSFRNSINYEETAALTMALEMARNRDTVLRDFWTASKNSVLLPGTTEISCLGKVRYPFAFVVPAAQNNMPNTVDMINNLLENGIDVSTANEAFTVSGVTPLSLASVDPAAQEGRKNYPAGSYIISMAQPDSRLIYTLLEPYKNSIMQRHSESGWQYGLMRNVAVDRVDNAAVLAISAVQVTKPISYPYTVSPEIATGYYAIRHDGINNIVTLTFSLAKAGYRCFIAQKSNGEVRSGDVLIPADQKGVYGAIKPLVAQLGFAMYTVAEPGVGMHLFRLPRIGLYHSWDSQDSVEQSGWSRLTFDRFEVPYTLIQHTDVIAGNLRDHYDVIFLPDVDADTMKLGHSSDPEELPLNMIPEEVSYGPVQTQHRNGGLGGQGINELKRFVNAGGVLICNNASTELPIVNGFISDITIQKSSETEQNGGRQDSFNAPGPLVRILMNRASSIAYGAGPEAAVPQEQSPVFKAPLEDIVASYPADPSTILLSGSLQKADKMAGKAAIVVAKAKDGTGRVVLFGTDVTYRWQAHGTFIYLWNALLNWDDLLR